MGTRRNRFVVRSLLKMKALEVDCDDDLVMRLSLDIMLDDR